MVQMRVRKEDRIDRPSGHARKQRQRHFAFLLGVHPAIKHHPLPARTEVITVGANLCPARQINELQNRAPTCQSRAREQSANFIRAGEAESLREKPCPVTPERHSVKNWAIEMVCSHMSAERRRITFG